MLYSTVQRIALWCSVVQWSKILHCNSSSRVERLCAMQYSAIQYSAVQYSIMPWCRTTKMNVRNFFPLLTISIYVPLSQSELTPHSRQLDPLPVLLEMGLRGKYNACNVVIELAAFSLGAILIISHFCSAIIRLFASMSLKEKFLNVAIFPSSLAKKQVS